MKNLWVWNALAVATACALLGASIARAETLPKPTDAESPESQPVAEMAIPGIIQGGIPTSPPTIEQGNVPRPQVPIAYSPSTLRTKTGHPLFSGLPGAVASPVAVPPMPMPMLGPQGGMYPGLPPVYPASAVMPASAMMPAMMPEPYPVMPATAPCNAECAGGCNGCGGGGCSSCGGMGPISGCLNFLFPQVGGLHKNSGGLLPGLGGGMKHLGLGNFCLGYGDAGCCAQRWFDIHAEAMFLSRDLARNGDFTSLGNTAVPPNIVLNTDDLSFENEEEGFRVTTAIQLGPGTSLEFGYFGGFNWADAAEATAPNGQLYSALSEFGTDPPGGFTDSDRSFLQRIEYSSTFDNFELNWRSRWVGPNCKFQGSWLMGCRYFYLDEDFVYLTRGDDPITPEPVDRFMDYTVSTINSLTGFQLGADLWTCIFPGLSLGAEGKCGLYGNSAKQTTHVTGNSIADYREAVNANEAAYIFQGDLMLVYRLTYSWTLRAGYHLLLVDGVALAPENFNSVPPDVFNPGPGNNRVASINANGNVFYHGGTIGLEWMW